MATFLQVRQFIYAPSGWVSRWTWARAWQADSRVVFSLCSGKAAQANPAAPRAQEGPPPTAIPRDGTSGPKSKDLPKRAYHPLLTIKCTMYVHTAWSSACRCEAPIIQRTTGPRTGQIPSVFEDEWHRSPRLAEIVHQWWQPVTGHWRARCPFSSHPSRIETLKIKHNFYSKKRNFLYRSTLQILLQIYNLSLGGHPDPWKTLIKITG